MPRTEGGIHVESNRCGGWFVKGSGYVTGIRRGEWWYEFWPRDEAASGGFTDKDLRLGRSRNCCPRRDDRTADLVGWHDLSRRNYPSLCFRCKDRGRNSQRMEIGL